MNEKEIMKAILLLKENEVIDAETAFTLVRNTFNVENPKIVVEGKKRRNQTKRNKVYRNLPRIEGLPAKILQTMQQIGGEMSFAQITDALRKELKVGMRGVPRKMFASRVSAHLTYFKQKGIAFNPRYAVWKLNTGFTQRSLSQIEADKKKEKAQDWHFEKGSYSNA